MSLFADGDEWVEGGDVFYGFVIYFGLNIGCYVSGGRGFKDYDWFVESGEVGETVC